MGREVAQAWDSLPETDTKHAHSTEKSIEAKPAMLLRKRTLKT